MAAAPWRNRFVKHTALTLLLIEACETQEAFFI